MLLVLRTTYGSECVSFAGKEDAAFVVDAVWFPGNGVRDYAARYDVAAGTLVGGFAYDTSDNHPSWFSWDDGWGTNDGGGVIRLTAEPGAPALTTVYASGSWQTSAKARRNLVLWVDWGLVPSPIRSWTKANGQRVLISGPWDVGGLGLDDATIAWVGVHGPMTAIGSYETAELYWSPYAVDPAAVAVTQGPDLTNMLAGHVPVGVGGDYVALSTAGDPGHNAGSAVIVVHMPTQKLWRIEARPGTFLRLAAVSTQEVVAMETDKSLDYALFQRYLRFDLSALDTLAQGWGP
ncbi:MAG: hypothetical protein HY908_35515 [Myxococcales bacterium]|nr:hypothetical protein [Myxococcales bacterium]